MQALRYEQPGTIKPVEVPSPNPVSNEAVVNVAYAGVCGTDLHIWSGDHPRAKTGLVVGHEFVGTLDTDVNELTSGTKVFVNPLLPCNDCPACTEGEDQVCSRLRLIGIDRAGGAAEQVTVPVRSLYALPPDADMRAAALIEPLSVCVRAIRRSGQRLGARVHVIGAGPIGLLVARASAAAGAVDVTISETSGRRSELASSLGFSLVDSPKCKYYDVVYDCTGHPSVAPEMLSYVVTGGTLVNVGMPSVPAETDLPDLMRRELRLIGTCVYRAADVRAALRLLTTGALTTADLTSVIRLNDMECVFSDLVDGNFLKVLMTPNSWSGV